jgi:hypothetical protein
MPKFYKTIGSLKFRQISQPLPLVIDWEATAELHAKRGEVCEQSELTALVNITPDVYNDQRWDISGFKPMIFKFSNGSRRVAIYKILEAGGTPRALMILLPSATLEHSAEDYDRYIKIMVNEAWLNAVEQQYKEAEHDAATGVVETSEVSNFSQTLIDWAKQIHEMQKSSILTFKKLAVLWEIAYCRERLVKAPEAPALMEQAKRLLFDCLSNPRFLIRLHEDGRIELKSGNMYYHLGFLKEEEYHPLINHLIKHHPHSNRIIADSLSSSKPDSVLEEWLFETLLDLPLPKDEWLSPIISRFLTSPAYRARIEAKLTAEGRPTSGWVVEDPVVPAAGAGAPTSSIPRRTNGGGASASAASGGTRELSFEDFLEALLPINIPQSKSKPKPAPTAKGLSKEAKTRIKSLILENGRHINQKLIMALCVRLMSHFKSDVMKDRFSFILPELVRVANIDLNLLSFEEEQIFFYSAMNQALDAVLKDIAKKGIRLVGMRPGDNLMATIIMDSDFTDSSRKFRDAIAKALPMKELRPLQPVPLITWRTSWVFDHEKLWSCLDPLKIVDTFAKWGERGNTMMAYNTACQDTNEFTSVSTVIIENLIHLASKTLPPINTSMLPPDEPVEIDPILLPAELEKLREQNERYYQELTHAFAVHTATFNEPLNLLSVFLIGVGSLYTKLFPSLKICTDKKLNPLKNHLDSCLDFFRYCFNVFITAGMDPFICPAVQYEQDLPLLIELIGERTVFSEAEKFRADFGLIHCQLAARGPDHAPQGLHFIHTLLKALLTYTQQFLEHGYDLINPRDSFNSTIPADTVGPAKMLLYLCTLYVFMRCHKDALSVDSDLEKEFYDQLQEILLLITAPLEIYQLVKLVENIAPLLSSYLPNLPPLIAAIPQSHRQKMVMDFFDNFVYGNHGVIIIPPIARELVRAVVAAETKWALNRLPASAPSTSSTIPLRFFQKGEYRRFLETCDSNDHCSTRVRI